MGSTTLPQQAFLGQRRSVIQYYGKILNDNKLHQNRNNEKQTQYTVVYIYIFLLLSFITYSPVNRTQGHLGAFGTVSSTAETKEIIITFVDVDLVIRVYSTPPVSVATVKT